METMGVEGRRQRSINSNAAMTVEQRSARAKKVNDSLGVEGRRAAKMKAMDKLMREIINITKSLYETDEYQWLLDQIKHLREEKYESLDRGNLLQYLEEMAGRDRRELGSRFVVLIQHMLKFRVQPERATLSWVNTVLTQQGEIESMFEEAPALKSHAPRLFANAYTRAVKQAARETKIHRDKFPATCPWTIDECLGFDPPDVA
ncbi:unnamed protein product [Sphagnum tenellum]